MTILSSLTQLISGCENEQLQFSGEIQDFGVLLCVERAAPFRITHASENLNVHFSQNVDQILGRPLQILDLLYPEQVEGATTREPGQVAVLPVGEGYTERFFDAHLFTSAEALVIELELRLPNAQPIAIHRFELPLLQSSELGARQQRQLLVDRIREVTDFDRVMVYKFHEDWSGEVIAEAAEPSMGSYFGLHFPASDIPAIARHIYLQNPARMIPSVDSPVIPIKGCTETPPDLTWSTLRSVSPLHLQYLRNMGVAASLSIPLVVHGKLWGLVACHHRYPKQLSPYQRKACVAMAKAHSLVLGSQLAAARLRMLDSIDFQLDLIMDAFSRFDSLEAGIEANGELLKQKLSAGIFACAFREGAMIRGEGLRLETLDLIDDWFMGHCNEWVMATDCLEKQIPEISNVAESVAGMLALKAQTPGLGWVRFYWFRPSETREVNWAGNPNKPEVEDAQATVLSPRRSFEKWVEIKTKWSRPWSAENMLIAKKIRYNLLRRG